MIRRMDTTKPTCQRHGLPTTGACDRTPTVLALQRDPWSNDPDRTTRQFMASVPPGGQR
jgi:hypothetical protein